MTDATCFLVPPLPDDQPFDHSRKVECRALVPVGRPRIALTREVAEKICDLVAGGDTIRKIGNMKGMPSRATIRRWIAENEVFRRAYALAKEGLVEDILEEINEIADDATNDYGLEEGADGTPVVREKKETIARAALRIATKFKLIGKIAPHKYGDVPPALTYSGRPWTGSPAHRWRRKQPRGRQHIRLYTNAAMTENLSMYTHMGFVETQRATEKGFHRVYMRLTLPRGEE